MKRTLATLILLLAASGALASDPAQDKLVAEYIEATRAKQVIGAEIAGSIQQYTTNVSPEQKSEMERYFHNAIGWNVIRNDYTALVQRTYSKQELKASLAFMKTPIGTSIGQKILRLPKRLLL